VKRVIINCRFLTQSVTGVQRFAIELCKQFKLLSSDFVFVSPKNVIHHELAKEFQVVTFGKLTGHLWEQIELPLYVGNSLLINLCNTAPILKRNQYVFIHDAAVFRFPKAYNWKFVWSYMLLGKSLKHSAKKIFTVSDFSRNELIECLGVRPEKIAVISPGIEISGGEDVRILEKLSITKQNYVLTVGSLDPKKNINGLIYAFKQLKAKEIDLVIVGSQNEGVFRKLKIANQDKIKLSGYVSDRELIALYKNALFFAFASFYEGFGLPPLEAMSLGCPVLVSNTASLPEVCGEAALYCDPFRTESIYEGILEMITNAELREQLTLRGPEQIAKYSYQKSARALVDFVNKEIE